MSSLILLAVPLFVLLGALIEMTGMAAAMVGFLVALLGHVRGGLNYVLLGAMYLISGISGSKAADMAAVAPVLFPEMKRRGIDEGEMVSLLSASGAMSETIPPSIVLIAIGSTTGVSIAALFTGGLVPALVLAVALGGVAWYRARRTATIEARRAPVRLIAGSFLVALPALVLPVVIRASVIEGVTTATEVSTVGIAYSVVAGIVIYRRFDWRRIYPMLVDTAALSGAILFIIGAATCMAWALTQSGFSHSLAAAMQALPGGRFGFLAVSIVAFIVLGSVLEGIPAMVLFGPLLFPIARGVGVNEVHYAMVAVLSMGLGLFAPPFGVGYYAACAVGRINPRCRHAPHLAVSRCAARGVDPRGGSPMAFDRLPLTEGSMRLANKVAIVTGGLSGIGDAIAHRFADEGARVIAADLATDAAELDDGRVAPFQTDVADPASVDRLVSAVVAKYGRLDCLVNSAGIGADVPFLETTLETFDRIIAINLRGSFIVGQRAARAMRDSGGGAILNIASVSGVIGNVGRSAYGASKGGVVLLSKVMAVDLAAYGIRVNVLAPGPISTPLTDAVHTPAVREKWHEQTILRRYGRPDEMAGAAVFLCSDDASYITGHVLAADGGFLAAGLTTLP